MLPQIYAQLARLIRRFPKTKTLSFLDMKARFFVPINNHYVCDDLVDISKKRREPKLYQWLNELDDNSILFDVGTSYGQEASLASSLHYKNIKVYGFDCSLYQSHLCALNKSLNQDRFHFIFAAIASKSGELIKIKTNSDTHIPSLHKKNVTYEYEVMSLSLDDFATKNKIHPTHIKMDIDGAEYEALKGAHKLLESHHLQEIFIEIDNDNKAIFDLLESYGFSIKWQLVKEHNIDVLFSKTAS